MITMDIEMPQTDGLTALRRIMNECPTQVLMFSSLTTEGSHVALRVNHEPVEAVYKPSVDALFHSMALHTGSRTLAVVLTGIGQDRLEGAKALHPRGGVIPAQDEANCVIYGMPKAVTDHKLTAASLKADSLAAALGTLAPAAAAPTARAG